MASKDKIKVIMRSSASRHFYSTTKNKRNKEKLSMTSYDPTKGVQKHVIYNEEKMK